MAAAHMASATIRKIQHDMHTRARSSSGALDDARLKADDKESDSGRSTREENGVALHSASSSPSDHTMSAENPIETSTAARFCPMDSSTPTKRIRNVTRNNDHHNQQQQIPNSSSSSSTIDTESTDSPLTGEIPHMSGPFATVSSQTQPFKAPIVGYEILEERVKFTVS